jgi:hypothetical protein
VIGINDPALGGDGDHPAPLKPAADRPGDLSGTALAGEGRLQHAYRPAIAAAAAGPRGRAAAHGLPGRAGSGARLLPESPDKTSLVLVGSRTFDSGVVGLTYAPKHSA